MYQEVLKSKQKKVFEKLGYFSDCYLVGGTALALQIGHRISEDFDFFRDKELDKKFISKLYRVFKDRNLKISFRQSGQFNFTVDSVKFNFVKYSYPLIFKLKKYKNVKLASAKEIALMKAFTLGMRITLKDYLDLYFVLKEGVMSLKEIIEGCDRKYKEEFNGRLFLEQLISTEEAEEARIEFLKKPITREEMKDFFEKEIKKLKL
ncbi:MAG: nucleotidyl transferase AbiEii/AbiGii toxin family protein [Patescibacteria group bacterium]|nr:nucleotidyl transferase AbiEii/AbiGii toxin family protein [Patescibacteria group bacterium]